MNALINMSRLSQVHGDKLVEQTINTRRRWVLMSSNERGASDAANQAAPSVAKAVETSSDWNTKAALRKRAATSCMTVN
jgi:hypothetical protein